jgi:hypothetical protein
MHLIKYIKNSLCLKIQKPNINMSIQLTSLQVEYFFFNTLELMCEYY